jgi:RNA polymerase sigma factor (sigma-70 family)
MTHARTQLRHGPHRGRIHDHHPERASTRTTASPPAADRDAAAGAQGWEWVRAAQHGDRVAFANVYTRYQPLVARTVAHRLGVPVTAPDVQDLTSEVFLRAWRGIERVTEQRTDPAAWLSVIARNAAKDHLKAAHTRISEPVESIANPATGRAISTREVAGDWTATAAAPAPSAESEALDRWRRAHATTLVRNAVATLTPIQQASVEAMLADESNQDEATRTGATVGAVKARRFRALHAIRRHLTTNAAADTTDAAGGTTDAGINPTDAASDNAPAAASTDSVKPDARADQPAPVDHPVADQPHASTAAVDTAAAGGGHGSRPHTWPCQHCGMVEDYRSTRETQIQLAEGRYDRAEGRDETYRPVVFKDWLQTYQWEREPDPTDPRQRENTANGDRCSEDADDGDVANDEDPWVPAPRPSHDADDGSDLTAARAAVAAALAAGDDSTVAPSAPRDDSPPAEAVDEEAMAR